MVFRIRRTYIYPSFLFDGTSDESSIAACSLALVPMFPVVLLCLPQVVDGFLNPRPLTLFSKRRVLAETAAHVRVRSSAMSEPSLLNTLCDSLKNAPQVADRIGHCADDDEKCGGSKRTEHLVVDHHPGERTPTSALTQPKG